MVGAWRARVACALLLVLFALPSSNAAHYGSLDVRLHEKVDAATDVLTFYVNTSASTIEVDVAWCDVAVTACWGEHEATVTDSDQASYRAWTRPPVNATSEMRARVYAATFDHTGAFHDERYFVFDFYEPGERSVVGKAVDGVERVRQMLAGYDGPTMQWIAGIGVGATLLVVGFASYKAVDWWRYRA